jgi:hypothetical protein
VETFEQRLQEHNGLLSQRFELFFSALQGGGSWWTHITETVAATHVPRVVPITPV